jgi:anti-sigma B factor antagonist
MGAATTAAMTVLAPAGDLDGEAAAALRPIWRATAGAPGDELLVVDLRDITFVDAAGLGLLVGVHNERRRHGSGLVLRNASPRVLRLLRLTGLDAVFPDAERPL